MTLSIHGITAIAVDADSVTPVEGLPGTQSEVALNVAAYGAPPGTIEGEMVSSSCSDSARRR